LRAFFDHSDASAESTHGLGQFKPHVSAAENDQMFRNTIEFESFHVSHRFRGRESGNVRYGGMSAQVQEDAVCGQKPGIPLARFYFNGFRTGEPSLAEDQFRSAVFVPAEMPSDLVVDHGAFASPNTLHADVSRLHLNAEFRGPRYERRDFGAVDDVLAGQTRDIRARSADPFPLDGGMLALLRQGPA
jgi:hypothetical protein